MAQKWDPVLRKYEPYSIPEGWFCPIMVDDMDLVVNCASCGNTMTYGNSYTSRFIHTDYGIGYCVCEDCLEKELAAENAARKENNE